MSDLSEALTAAGAAALVQKEIDPVLLEYQRRYAPLTRAISTVKWNSTVYYFNKRTTNPAGGFVTDGGARPVSNSMYVQENFQMKLLQSVGAVTGYAEEVTAAQVNSLRAREIEGAAKGLLWDIETAMLWGAATPTVTGPYPQFDGLDVMCASFSNSPGTGPNQGIGGGAIDAYGGANNSTGWGYPTFSPWVENVDQNAIDCGGNTLTLGMLDLVIDMVESNVAEPVDSEWMFVLSPSAASRISQLLYAQQRFEQVEIAAGLVVHSYRGIPLVKSSFLAPRTNQFPAVTATATSGGTLNAAYKYKVSAVIARFGEIQASAEASVSPATQAVSLTFSAVTGPEGSLPTHYKVYRTAAAGGANSETLLGYVDAAFNDSSGTSWVTTSILDTGSYLLPKNGSNVPGITPSTYYYTNANLKPLTASGEQNIYLLSRNPNYVVRPYIREMKPVDVYPTTSSPDALPFAFVADTTLALRGPKYVGRLANVIGAIDKNAGNGVVPTTTSYSPAYVVD